MHPLYIPYIILYNPDSNIVNATIFNSTLLSNLMPPELALGSYCLPLLSPAKMKVWELLLLQRMGHSPPDALANEY
jgi:hypothetical protein